MRTVDVGLGERAYPIHIGAGLLDEPSLWPVSRIGRSVLIVSDEHVAPLYLARLRTTLGEREVASHIIAPGEASKTLAEMAGIVDALLAHGARRDATLVALGGGVVGDLAGFAAASFMRGIRFAQVPTTLLAQVDSSVGGKTGVNHREGKNLIGAFHQPVQVLIDTATLATLAPREGRAGLAEVLKTALLADGEFFAWQEANLDTLRAHDADALAKAIARCCEIKAGVVARDEKERGERMLLNLGHTFGHAIEKVSGYGAWLHGEAVGAGLVMAADLSVRCGLLGATDCARVRAVVAAAGLPVRADGLSAVALKKAMSHDKKFRHGHNRFVLLERLGRARVVEDVDAPNLDACLAEHAA